MMFGTQQAPEITAEGLFLVSSELQATSTFFFTIRASQHVDAWRTQKAQRLFAEWITGKIVGQRSENISPLET